MKLGSAPWLAWVFSTPSVRNAKARPGVLSRPQMSGSPQTLYGANERLAGYVLDYFTLAGVVKRWKAGPFEWPMPGEQVWRPTLFAELAGDRSLVAIQVKWAKFLTAERQEALDKERAFAEAAGITQVLWTDDKPLTPAFRDLYARIRRGRTAGFDPSALTALVTFVREGGQVTAQQVVDAGIDPALIEVALHKLQLYTRMDTALTGKTVLSTTPLINGREFLLLSGFDAESWWHGLEKVT